MKSVKGGSNIAVTWVAIAAANCEIGPRWSCTCRAVVGSLGSGPTPILASLANSEAYVSDGYAGFWVIAVLMALSTEIGDRYADGRTALFAEVAPVGVSFHCFIRSTTCC